LLVGVAYWSYGAAAVVEPSGDFFVGTPATPEVLAGALIFEEQGCESCHSVLGQGGHDGRDLWRAGERRTRSELAQLLVDPPSGSAARAMPSYAHLTDRDLAAVVAFLAGSDFARAEPARVPREVARGGGELYRSRCLDCHDDRAPESAPDLNGLVARLGVEGMTALLADPALHQDMVPPVAVLSETRRDEIVAYLTAAPGMAP
jgi:mono/diheme cytochrome c family protein